MDQVEASPGAGRGAAAIAWLDHHHFGRGPAPAADPGLDAWLEEIAPADESMLGLDPADLDAERFAALRAAGAALAPGGDLRWGVDVVEDAAASEPAIVDRILRVPPPDRLAACNGVELLALRRWFGQRIGLRLQAAPRIACYCWTDRALLASSRDERVAGFLHGPGPDQRHTLAWAPGEAVLVRW